MNTTESHYDKEYFEWNNQDGDRIALKWYSDLFRKYVKRGNILDFGCGKGYLLNRFPKLYKKYGFDISPYVKAFIKKTFPGIKIINELGSVKENTFDGIITLHTLEHIPRDELKKIINTLYKILKKGGYLMAVMPNISGLAYRLKGKKWGMFRDKTHVSLLQWREWEGLFTDVGFKIIKKGTDGLWDVPYISWLPNIVNKILFYPLPFFQIVMKNMFLPFNSGESIIFICKKE